MICVPADDREKSMYLSKFNICACVKSSFEKTLGLEPTKNTADVQVRKLADFLTASFPSSVLIVKAKAEYKFQRSSHKITAMKTS